MRKFLFIIIVILFAQLASAQQIFAPIGAKWHYSSSSQGAAPPDAAYWIYESEKDTIYNGISCQKIYTKKVDYLGDTIIGLPYFTYTSGDTVMYFNSYVNKFTPLYIFNVNVGDTLTFYKPDNIDSSIDSTFRVIVDSITFISINSYSLQRIHTSRIDFYEFKNHFTERIGGDVWLLPEYYTSIPEREVGPLRCYSDNDIDINFTSNSCDYRVFVGLNENKVFNGIDVYPNPSGNDYIKVVYKNKSPDKIYLFDLFGKAKEISFKHDENTSNVISIDITLLNSGTYFLKIQFYNGESVVRKMIKEN
jgi:hypothetical protein